MKPMPMLLVSCVWLAAAPAAAGVLIHRLPGDGAWASYHATLTVINNDGESRDVAGRLTLRSVGQATEKGRPSRWIELEFQLQPDDGEFREIVKLLIPEEQLQKGGRPLAHFVRGWRRQPEGDGGELRQVSSSDDLAGSPSRLWLQASLDDPQPIAKKTVEYQSGRLECDGVAGGFKSQADDFTFEGRASVWTHADAPFGAAALRHEGQALSNGETVFRFVLDLSLHETGRDARSSLPERD